MVGFYATDEGCVCLCVCVWGGGGGGGAETRDWDVMLHCVVYVSVKFAALCRVSVKFAALCRVCECKICCTVSCM